MRYKKLVLNIMTAILILYSCTKDKLNQPALGLVDEATLANKHGVEGLLIGAYSLLDGVSGDSQLLVPGVLLPPTGSMEVSVEVKLTRDRNPGDAECDK